MSEKKRPNASRTRTVGQSILAGLSEAVTHARGENVPGLIAHIPEHVDVEKIRTSEDLTQEEFSARYGFKVGTLRDWEQKRRRPHGSARVLLKMIEKEPAAVHRVLGLKEAKVARKRVARP